MNNDQDIFLKQYMSSCSLCPRACGADRYSGFTGFCGVPATVYVARAALHFWEEPCISGSRGSGAVFFTGCGLKCVFCQNAPISGTAGPKGGYREPEGAGKQIEPPETKQQVGVPGAGHRMETQYGILGKPVTVSHLAGIFLRLQNEQGANNINLVTAAQYIPQVAAALRMAKDQGLVIPVVYNSSGYEKVEALRLLEGLVDVWLPDFKYMDTDMARRYSHAPDYPDRAKMAIAEMFRQAGKPEFYTEKPFGGAGQRSDQTARSCYPPGQKLIRKGVIVRHLLMPGHVKNAEAVVRYLHDTYGDSICISMMNQYTPMETLKKTAALTEDDYRLLARKTTKREYERLIDYAVEIGVNSGFIQEGGTAKESFIPSWNGEGV